MSIKQITQFFDNYLPLDQQEIQRLETCLIHRKVKRRQFLLSQGEKCRNYIFVLKGCLKMYKVDEAAKEHNLLFAIENEWISDIGSFHNDVPSELYIEALEPTEVFELRKNDLINLYTNFPKFDRNFRVVVENQYIELQQRLLQTISSTAEERYLSFLEQYPKLQNRLPNTQIASYLGITPEFLSRIRNTMSKK